MPWLGEVPEHWEQRSLWTVSEPRIEKNPGGLQLLSVFLNRGVIRYKEGGGQVHAPSLDLTNYQVVHPGDFVLNNQQAWRGSVGVSRHHGIVSPAYIVLRLIGLDAAYADYLFQCPAMVDQFVTASKGVGDIQRQIYWPFLRFVQTLRPSLPEQAAIVRYLDHADRRIRRYIRAKQKLITLLEEQKQAIIHQAVTGQIDVRTGQPYPAYKDSGVEWLGDVPEHWQLLRLKNVAHVQTGLTLGKDYRGTRTTSRPYLRVANVQAGCLDLTHVKSIDVPLNEADRATLLTGDVLMTEGGDIDKLGRGCVWRDEISKCLHQNHIFAVRCKHGLLSPEFLVGLMASQHGRAYFELTAKQTTNLASTNSSTLRAFSMPLPVLEEQVAILNVLSEETNAMGHAMGQAEREIDLMREYRTRLIADVVTGKLDVREAAAGLPEVDPLAGEFDALTTQAAETGMMELGDATETPEELAMENEVTI